MQRLQTCQNHLQVIVFWKGSFSHLPGVAATSFNCIGPTFRPSSRTYLSTKLAQAPLLLGRAKLSHKNAREDDLRDDVHWMCLGDFPRVRNVASGREEEFVTRRRRKHCPLCKGCSRRRHQNGTVKSKGDGTMQVGKYGRNQTNAITDVIINKEWK